MIAIVTATLDWDTAASCIQTWLTHARGPVALYVVDQKPAADATPGWTEITRDIAVPHVRLFVCPVQGILGVVPAFAVGVQKALEDGHEIIACLHDDLDIMEPAWDVHVRAWFETHPQMGLCGFGGGLGLGDTDIYQKPYHPMQLARRTFVSNMKDAMAHGGRSMVPLKVACLDGFSQIGRREFWRGVYQSGADLEQQPRLGDVEGPYPNLFAAMEKWGIIHHAYDAALGCFARRLGWETWMVPVSCHHYGGRTAVGNKDYQKWANEKPLVRDINGSMAMGDQGFWLKSHEIVYKEFRDVLPID